jgi:hypothetical protein
MCVFLLISGRKKWVREKNPNECFSGVRLVMLWDMRKARSVAVKGSMMVLLKSLIIYLLVLKLTPFWLLQGKLLWLMLLLYHLLLMWLKLNN